MQKQSIPGGIKLLKNQQGNILLLGVFIMIVIAALFAGMVEVGRVMIVREQLQTAADSAALAGAGSGTHRQVKINVTTDRGKLQPPCSGDEDDDCPPPCEDCGEQTISGIIGNEADLIDKGEWRDFCVEPCDCGGGDCWFEVVERELMYDTYSMGWGTTTQELNKAENDLTKATREILSKYMYQCSFVIARMVVNKSLPQMSALLGNREYWIMEWMYAGNYNPYCNYPRYLGQVSDKEMECQRWRAMGYSYYPQAAERKPMVDRMINNIDNIRSANSKPINKVDTKYAGAAGQFFNANLPKNAVDAGIQKLTVYGYPDTSSPYYPSVVVYATAKIKTLFNSDNAKLFQIFSDDFTTTVCAQGTTAFKDVDDQVKKSQVDGHTKMYGTNYGKWRKMPDKACWVDW